MENKSGLRKRKRSRDSPPNMSNEERMKLVDDNTVRMSQSDSEVRIVLLGKTGTGKSATGNAILGGERFKEDFSPVSVTVQSEKHEAIINGKRISVVDTPGIINTSLTEEELRAELGRSVRLCFPGPHVFLLMIKLGVRFTEEERNAVKWVQKNFGKGALRKFTIVIFTGEIRGQPQDIPRLYSELQEYIGNFPERYFILNNTQPQISRLMEQVEDILASNGGKYYTYGRYLAAQEMFREEKKENVMRKNLGRILQYVVPFLAFVSAFYISYSYVFPAIQNCFSTLMEQLSDTYHSVTYSTVEHNHGNQHFTEIMKENHTSSENFSQIDHQNCSHKMIST